ncbi:hypothetical protein ACWGII_19410 [Streptomyces sp. NPDC054855]
MQPVLPDLTGPASGSPSVLELAFTEGAYGADPDDEVFTRLLDSAYEQFCRMRMRAVARQFLVPMLEPPRSARS